MLAPRLIGRAALRLATGFAARVWARLPARSEADEDRFFHEVPGNRHLDHRYGRLVGPEETRERLRFLLREFMGLCDERGIEPILMFGGLIGWSFNGELLPWDDDLDLTLAGASIERLRLLDGHATEEILIEVNPHAGRRRWRKRDPNAIDGRVICRRTGHFLDLTFLTSPRALPFLLRTKFPHDVFLRRDVLPPRRATFEGVPVYVPRHVENVLVSRYGLRVRSPVQSQARDANHKRWRFDPAIRRWRQLG